MDLSSSLKVNRFDFLQARSAWWKIGAVAAVVAGAYWPTFEHLWGRWSLEPEYSHGFFVPVFSLVLLWLRREQVADGRWKGSWWGLALVAIGEAIRFVAAYEFYRLLGALALLPTLAGLAVLAGGTRALRWAAPSILFLIFMIPLPGTASDLLAQPLQRVAAKSSTYLLQLIGIPATAEGNTIVLASGKLDVVEACSGLRMLMLFIAVSSAVACLVNRSLWERVLVIASSIPIALAVNIVRIALTGIVQEVAGEASGQFFHKHIVVWLMGPAALALLWLELKFIDHALVSEPEGPLMLGVGETKLGGISSVGSERVIPKA